MIRDRTQLPYLLQLLDDDSPTVRTTVLERLAAFGPSLEEELAVLGITLTSGEVDRIHSWIHEQSREWLREVWPSWFYLEDEKEGLETALAAIAEYLEDRYRPRKMQVLLDQLADEYRSRYSQNTLRDLAAYLFQVKGLKGARDDYYNPLNSSLIHVIETQSGIPLSLVAIYMLVGRRLGLTIDGCNFPGHFLALATEDDHPLVIDCFNGGLIIDDLLLSRYLDPVTVTVDDLTKLRADIQSMVFRVLRNLMNAYRSTDQPNEVELMKELMEMSPGEAVT